MQEHVPFLLTRRKAIEFIGKGRRRLETLVEKGVVKFIVTKGGHRRFRKEDLIKAKNEELQNQ